MGQITSTFAQCDYLGEVIDGADNGGCGLLVHAVQDGNFYEPTDDFYNLQPGQVISFSIDSTNQTQGCDNATPVLFTCFELISDNCSDQGLIDLATPCSAEDESVCGCDGQTYVNACQAENWYGVTAWTVGPCTNSVVTCQAHFMYTFLDNQTVLFFNNSQDHTGCEWDFGDGYTASYGDLMSFTKVFDNDHATVCLKVWNDNGCQDEFCLNISHDAPEDMCNTTDCIWPGDTNGDGTANNIDVLNLGLGIGNHGTERPFFPDPENPITWAPNYGYDWASWVGPVNYKHLDCDGDGVINEADLDAIYHNYTPDFDLEFTPDAGSPPISIAFDQSTFVIDENTPEYVVVSASIYLGSEALPFIDLHGLAFNISYPHNLSKANGVTTDIDPESFLGNASSTINFSYDLYDEGIGRYDGSISRRNGQGMSGFGKVAKVNFVVNSDIIEGLSVPETPFDILLEEVTMINAGGDIISFGTDDNQSTITFINSNVSNTIPITPEQLVNIFPNPVETMLYINMEQVNIEQVDFMDAYGRVLWSRYERNMPASIELNVSSFEPGLYLIRFSSEGSFFTKKVIIE